ncbi:hypothetical protein Cflav_PD2366 [Pedosphaera parvula Ellin514]|uniref:Uncharacterized protein n=2 Tax=Pedosphaera TaxID=1032526 RepID=B9XL28_PEDPL|nr:hypothetical protein Cflav_PD2366 [Pedosphaera parvula Ellin514]
MFSMAVLVVAVLAGVGRTRAERLATVEEVVHSKIDLWGEAALRQPNGPSYEFFEPLLPALRYVSADFHYYPIVLSAPFAKQKARLISNGSGINLRGGARGWRDVGVPVMFRVGPDEFLFGNNVQHLEGPHLAEGFLPIVEMNCKHGECSYSEESFAAMDPALCDHALVFTRFGVKQARKTPMRVCVQVDSKTAIKAGEGRLQNEKGETILWFDGNWKWEATRGLLSCDFKTNLTATLAIATVPFAEAVASPLATNGYVAQRDLAVNEWKKLLDRGMKVEVPEPLVNNAWRSLILQNFSLMNGNSMRYSAANQYDSVYESEGSDATTAMLLWGFTKESARLFEPLMDVSRKGMELNYAGQKLENVAVYFWETRDKQFLDSLRPKWEREVQRIVGARDSRGLLPRGSYCNDIPMPIISLNTHGKCWRGLRDLSKVLGEAGYEEESKRLTRVSSEFRSNILTAVDQSIFTNTQPPFVPIALFGDEQPCDPICATKMGSYWNLVSNFVLNFGALEPGSQRETWLTQYIQQHGGLCMGMARSLPAPGWWVSPHNMNPLYGMHYGLTLLRRDEPDRALVTFYGMLAQGLTRETFVAGEGNSIVPLDAFGRQFMMPPNSGGNAHVLQMLRYLLVQDFDLNDDGEPDTLRLCFSTPRRWLEDGKTIAVEDAPTAFGPLSMKVQSKLKAGEVDVELSLPVRNKVARTLFRARLPEGWKVISANVGAKEFVVDDSGTVDLATLAGKQNVRFKVVRQ